jgi:hypothetical protein
MADMTVNFLGGDLDGQSCSPIDENELTKLGYRASKIHPLKVTNEIMCIAVPTSWTQTEEKQALDKKFQRGDFYKRGKKSL